MVQTSLRRRPAVTCRALVCAVIPLMLSGSALAQPAGAPGAASTSSQGGNELDAFMERVLDNREASWRRLGDFVLSETETLDVDGPLGIPLAGFRHEYEWYVRDEVVVRSPVRFDGVEIDEAARRAYETNWLDQERRRLGRRDRRRRVASRRSTATNVALAIERTWGGEVSEPLGKRIAADADLVGDDLAAITLNTGAILEDLGGVEAVGFGAAVARTRDLFVMLDTERLTVGEVGRALRRPLATLVDQIDAADPAALASFVELARLGEQFQLDARDLSPALERAARRLETRGDTEVAATLEEIRRRLVQRSGSGDARGPDDLGRGDAAGDPDDPTPAAGAPLLDSGRLEPRFISEAYFMEFPFEPGNYYLAGRETLAGREVVRIEYYPTELFDDVDADDSELGERINRGFNKTSLVTLWIDPAALQIVKYTFDNTGLDFLPARWLVRVEELEATMEMGQPIGDVWLPMVVTVSGRATMALGDVDLTFTREFADHREARTGGRLVDVGDPR